MRKRFLILLGILLAEAMIGFSSAQAVQDTTPPSLVSFSLAPSTIDTSSGPQTIKVTAHITDDLSGASDSPQSQVRFISPTGKLLDAIFYSPTRISGTPTDGEYRYDMNVPQYSDEGTWTVQRMLLIDQVGNQQELTGNDMGAAGFPTSFSNQPGSGRALAVSKTGSGTGTVVSDPPGINCGSTCSTSFSVGTAVTLSATQDSDSQFVGWSGDCAGAGACYVTMDGAKNVTAMFERQAGQPDNLIRGASDHLFIGNDIYNSTRASQTRTLKVKPGKKAVFVMRTENDGNVVDNFLTRGSGGSGNFGVRYYDAISGANLTHSILMGTSELTDMAPGDYGLIKIVVSVKLAAKPGASRSISVLAWSETDPAKMDAVGARIKVV